MNWTTWTNLTAANPAMVVISLVICGAGILLVASWAAGRRRWQRRSRRFFDQLEESTASHALPHSAPSAAGFDASLEPAPDPFAQCSIRYRTHAAYNPLAWPLQLISPPPERLVIQADLPSPPASALIWTRGRAPAVALGRGQPTNLWTLHRLDFVDAEYATHGELTNGIQHIFSELQTRYGPFLLQVTVSADGQPHLRLSLASARLDPAGIPMLLALVQGLGRAARIG